ncbi:hypothetical protein AWL63_23625 (plasmid) [Sphingomonas panacis]|uniref:HTH gntR-type domain-containing protein n=1 Tax=Sphingomonas panacis TaxID=1560345 RepID=A0A1B3ZIA3_9SPHN|nr:GntR family transcriptional regulator [Sphingomonas panacis]AOH87161.1 hypothetical protein AWL63_23625 [Sphingomonas panacis]
MPNAKKSPASRTQHVYEQIRVDLLNGRLPPGDKLVISELCQRFSANQSAVREALSRFTSEGLVDAQPQRGFRVAPVAPEDLHHLTEVRLLVEAPCIRSAIENTTIAWEQAIVAALHGLLRTPRHDDTGNVTQEWADAHNHFHRTLVATCDNPWLLRMRDMLMLQSERYRWFSLAMPDKRHDLGKEYSRIADAFLAHDAELAIDLMSDHFRRTAEIVLHSGEEPKLASRRKTARSTVSVDA